MDHTLPPALLNWYQSMAQELERPDWAAYLVAVEHVGVYWCDASLPGCDQKTAILYVHSHVLMENVRNTNRVGMLEPGWPHSSSVIPVALLPTGTKENEVADIDLRALTGEFPPVTAPLRRMTQGFPEDSLKRLGEAIHNSLLNSEEAAKAMTTKTDDLIESATTSESASEPERELPPGEAFPANGYERLHAVFRDAHDQAAFGKGHERHANGLPFHKQRMQTLSLAIGNPYGMVFQLGKKTLEGLEMEDPARRRHELLGALNYLAGVIIFLDDQEAAKAPAEPVSRFHRTCDQFGGQCSCAGSECLAAFMK